MFSQSSSCNGSKMKPNANNSNQTQNNNAIPAARQSRLTGQWGGQGVSMEVTEDGANLSFDCAHGSIAQAIAPDSNGKFAIKGLFAREHPGPIREGEDNGGAPATYAGVIEGETLTLTITLTQGNESVGTFTLTNGKTGRLRRCM
jgi:hypothetical protein